MKYQLSTNQRILFLFFLIACVKGQDSCFVGCSICTDSSYSSCTSCNSGRGEPTKNEAVYSSCFCINGNEELFEQSCSGTSESYKAVSTLSSILIIVMMVCVILLAISGNHLVSFLIYDNFQLIGYLRLINVVLPSNLDNILYSLQNLNIDVLLGKALSFNSSLKLSDNSYSTQKVVDIEDQNIKSPAKLAWLGFSYSFFYNMSTLLIIYFVVGGIILSLVYFHKIRRRKTGFLYYANQKRYTITVRLITISICQLLLGVILQFRNVSFATGFNGFSFILSILSLILIIGFYIFLIFAINYSIEAFQTINPKFNTYFDKLKNKNSFNRNIICIQVLIKLLFISFIFISTQFLLLSLLLLLALYVVYTILIVFYLRLTKRRYLALYLFLCITVTVEIFIFLIYAADWNQPKIDSSSLIRTSWAFIVFLLLQLFACTFYVLGETIMSVPILLNYLLKSFNYIKKKINGNEEDEEQQKEENNIKNITNNLEIPLSTRRKIATRNKRLQVNGMRGSVNGNTGEWIENPNFETNESDLSIDQKEFQQELNFELSARQKNQAQKKSISLKLKNSDL